MHRCNCCHEGRRIQIGIPGSLAFPKSCVNRLLLTNIGNAAMFCVEIIIVCITEGHIIVFPWKEDGNESLYYITPQSIVRMQTKLHTSSYHSLLRLLELQNVLFHTAPYSLKRSTRYQPIKPTGQYCRARACA